MQKLHHLEMSYPIDSEFIIVKRKGEHPASLNLDQFDWDIKIQKKMPTNKALNTTRPQDIFKVLYGKVTITGRYRHTLKVAKNKNGK